MNDIRFVDSDGQFLKLETQDGESFQLVIDDALKSAIKRDSLPKLDDVTITPREIQDAVRAGASAEELAELHGAPFDYVDKFAQTVIDEIGHIVASAQTVRIAIAADKYSDATQMEFREVLHDRIHNLGGSNLAWSASKQELEPWQVTVSFDVDGAPRLAVWSFDPRKLVLSPENEQAVKLSTGDQGGHIVVPKLRQVERESTPVQSVQVTEVIEFPAVAEPEPATATLKVVSPIEQLTRKSVEEASDLAAKAEVVQDDADSSVAAQSNESLSATADLLEAIRRKRAEQTAPSSSAETVKVEPIPVEPARAEPAKAEVEKPAVTPPAKKGRPSMPSWDQIVFGTKTED